ncbi:MAG: YqaE/Pmp3 family membrane protein [Crocinitomicaceae bacterium]
MKRNFMLLFTGLLGFVLLQGCATSNDVVSNGFIQKRKYNKGFFVKTGEKKSNLKKSEKQDILVETPSPVKSYETVVRNEKATIAYTETADKVLENNTHESVSPVTHTQVIVPETTHSAQKVISKAVKSKVITKPGIAKQMILAKNLKKEFVRSNRKVAKNYKNSDEVPTGLLYVLCFFIPFLAVGLATDWDIKALIINLILTALCGIPGIIHALIVVSKNR